MYFCNFYLPMYFSYNQDPELMAELKAIFDDLPVTQWENLETGKYWAKMVQNGRKQNVD